MKAFRTGVLSIVLAAALAAPGQAATQTVAVGQNGDRFTPADITITQGDTVTWNWADGGHNVKSTSGPESFTSPYGNRGATWSRTFSTPGTYTYVCEPHSDEMRGTITVTAAPQPEPQPQPQPQPESSDQARSQDSTQAAGSGATDAAPAEAGPTTTAILVARGVPVIEALRASVRRRIARLSVRVTENATLVIGLRRLGGGRKVVRIRRRTVRAGASQLRVGLRGLPRGRYRLRVVALDGQGNRSPARVARLRYR